MKRNATWKDLIIILLIFVVILCAGLYYMKPSNSRKSYIGSILRQLAIAREVYREETGEVFQNISGLVDYCSRESSALKHNMDELAMDVDNISYYPEAHMASEILMRFNKIVVYADGHVGDIK